MIARRKTAFFGFSERKIMIFRLTAMDFAGAKSTGDH
jgi:hypothetical protein